MRPLFGSNHTLSAFRQPPMYLSSILKMPGRAGNFVGVLRRDLLVDRPEAVLREEILRGRALDEADELVRDVLVRAPLSTAIGSSISIDWRGITYWMSWPFSRALSASLS